MAATGHNEGTWSMVGAFPGRREERIHDLPTTVVVRHEVRVGGKDNLLRVAKVRGDLDQAVHHGLTAFGYDRKTEASLLSRAADLNRILTERYPNERLTNDFREGCIEAQTDLPTRAHARA
jgi:hypothetical protein